MHEIMIVVISSNLKKKIYDIHLNKHKIITTERQVITAHVTFRMIILERERGYICKLGVGAEGID
jgi:hypothetical protein